MSFDAKDFRRALGQFPTGVTVITTLDESGEPVGVTASSFNTVSIDPPLILWSIDKGANSLSAFENAKHFAVNVLGRDQVSTSNNFASRGEDKFANADYRNSAEGIPLLNDYAAQFECKTWAVYEGGDHLILVGEVLDYRNNDEIEPLVFARGSYAVSAQHPEMMQNQAEAVTAPENDFVGDYLLYLVRETYQRFSNQLYPRLNQECQVTPEEWRILARMINQPEVPIEQLTDLVMQPEVTLRQTADWMTEKGLIHYKDQDTLEATESGATLARQLQTLALDEEAKVLKNLTPEQSANLKSSLKTLLDKL